MELNKRTIVRFFKLTSIAYTVAIVVITVLGIVAGEAAMDSSFYVEGGLSYSILIEMLVLSIITAIINIILDSDYFKNRIRLVYLTLIRLFIVLLFTTIFIFIFNWFPTDDVLAWVSFLVTFISSFIIATIMSISITRKKDKEYKILLDSFKKKRGILNGKN